mgnify:CR=1 FL=1
MNAEITELRDSARTVLGEAGLAASEDKTWPLALELGEAGEYRVTVSNGAAEVPLLPVASLSTYQTQPANSTVASTWPVASPSVSS